MQRVLTIPEGLYRKLQLAAQERGLPSIEKLLEDWQKRDSALKRRRLIAQRITALREQLQHTQGQFPDSVALLQEDRAR